MANGQIYLTVKEAAELLRLSPHTLRSWCSMKKITYQKIGRKVFFKRSVLDDFVERNTIKEYKPKGGIN